MHLFPLWEMDNALSPLFQYFSKGIETLGRETVTQLFLLNQVNSVYLSGRILRKTYATYIEDGFETIILVQNPYEEFAERLLVLSNISRLAGGHFGLRDSVEMRATIGYAETLIAEDRSSGDDKKLRRALRQIPPQVAATLACPLVRLLTASTPDEMPNKAAVATALDLLASATIVGLRHEADKFLSAVAQLLNINPGIHYLLCRSFRRWCSWLKGLKIPERWILMLEKDLELYHYIVEASQKWQFRRPNWTT